LVKNELKVKSQTNKVANNFRKLAGTRTHLVPAMTKTIILLTLFSITFGFSAICQLDQFSIEVQKINTKSFDLRITNPVKAKELNSIAFEKIKGNKVDLIVHSNTYSISGSLAQQDGDYKTALDHFQKCLYLRKQVPTNIPKLADIYLNIANLHYEADNSKNAIYYYKKSIYYNSKVNRKPIELISVYNGLSQAYDAIQKPDSALLYYQKALGIIPKVKDQEDQAIADVYSNLGQLYETNGQFILATAYLEKALKIQRLMNDYYGMAWTYHHLGIVSDAQSDSPNAKMFFHKAERFAIKQQDVEIQRDLCESWMRLYTRERKADSVVFYLEKFKSLNDTINKQKTDRDFYELETKYQTNEKKAELKNANERESLYKTGIIIASLTFLLILFFLIRNYRQKQRIALLQVDVKNNEINELLNQQEAASYEAMLEGQDQERLRIARELHDRLGSTLATIKLGLQNEEIPQAQQQVILVNTAISEVRTIAHDLSGGNIEQYGLAAALNELKNTLDRSGKITLNLFMETVNIQASLHVTIYRIVQELVSNTLKHAEATEITLQLSSVDEQLTLIYEDNGKGFDLTHYQPGMGITNIRHRIEKWNGSLEIDAQPNRGTIVILTVPITMQHD
jgi:two-component system, NarL family, sensor kinase